jgi:hypothetical protein
MKKVIITTICCILAASFAHAQDSTHRSSLLLVEGLSYGGAGVGFQGRLKYVVPLRNNTHLRIGLAALPASYGYNKVTPPQVMPDNSVQWSTSSTSAKGISASLGLERRAVISRKLYAYYGMDLAYNYFRTAESRTTYTLKNGTTTQEFAYIPYGGQASITATTFAGLRYAVSNRLTLNYEARANVFGADGITRSNTSFYFLPRPHLSQAVSLGIRLGK